MRLARWSCWNFFWDNRDQLSVFLLVVKLYNSSFKCKESMITSDTNILTWMKIGSFLTNQDVASFYKLSTKSLNAQSLGVGIASVSG